MYDINLQSQIPIYEQVYKRIIELIVKKRIKPNDQLPSVRALAKELDVNPNTISKAYLQLEHEKIIYSLAGRGSFVADINTGKIQEKALIKFEEAVSEAINTGITKQDLVEIIYKRKGE